MIPDQTRREWVFTIARATAAGVGIAWNGWGDTAPQRPVSLPPGVYLPSSDHLSHALMSADRFHPIPVGCPIDYVRPRSGPFKPLFFAQEEFTTVRQLVAVLLGESSSATDEHGICQEIAEWIDLVVSGQDDVRAAEQKIDPLYRAVAIAYNGSAEPRGRATDSPSVYRDGLKWLSQQAQSKHQKEFSQLDAEQQVSLLESISDARPDKDTQNPGTRLFTLLKAETINGFYTSQMGLKELNYRGNAYYASSPGCNTK